MLLFPCDFLLSLLSLPLFQESLSSSSLFCRFNCDGTKLFEYSFSSMFNACKQKVKKKYWRYRWGYKTSKQGRGETNRCCVQKETSEKFNELNNRIFGCKVTVYLRPVTCFLSVQDISLNKMRTWKRVISHSWVFFVFCFFSNCRDSMPVLWIAFCGSFRALHCNMKCGRT